MAKDFKIPKNYKLKPNGEPWHPWTKSFHKQEQEKLAMLNAAGPRQALFCFITWYNPMMIIQLMCTRHPKPLELGFIWTVNLA